MQGLAFDDRKCSDTPSIQRLPVSDDGAQVGFTMNWKIKTDGMHVGLVQPIGYAALQSHFEFAAVLSAARDSIRRARCNFWWARLSNRRPMPRIKAAHQSQLPASARSA